MRFCMLRSGSSGNCTFLEHGGTKILLDAGGMSMRGMAAVLAEINERFADINALVVTHLHSDHLNQNSLVLCRDHGVPLHIHESNVHALADMTNKHRIAGLAVRPFACARFTVGGIVFSPFVVGHDARETTCGFTFWAKESPLSRIAFATDLGCFPDDLVPHFADCECIVLESNHDTGLLWDNPRRPYFHKVRVASDEGHLSNEQAAQALVKIYAASKRPPRTIVLSHLSADHNSPEMAIGHVAERLREHGIPANLLAAYRDKRMEFIRFG
ncbi:MAG TPA: MBL fold metallo-hydrolase [Chitinivibrionales bacterium]|nr:MBL fold metallo-hydrolase [Chitinivibrionales bacterium]